MGRALILRNCKAVDERGARDGPVDILVRDGLIAEIATAGTSSSNGDAATLDLHGATVAPGLVNMHEHLGNAHPGTLEERAIEGEDEAGAVLRMAGNAQKALRAGVTSMRLVGEKDGRELKVRNAIVKGLIDGPRIWTAGAPLDFKGGHGGTVGALEGSSPAEYERFAKSQVDRGVELLKLMICGGGAGRDLEDVKMTPDEFEAIRAVARATGVKMSIHTAAVDHPIMDRLIEDGVDSLEHCYLIPEHLLERCISRHLLLVMTPLVGRSPEYFEAIELPADMVERLSEAGREHWRSIRLAVEHGARLALGTDFHSHLEFGGTWAAVRELEVYEEAGVAPRELLALASRNGAEWLGMSDQLGLVEQGFLADLVVLGRNPLSDGASAFRDLRYVIARGDVFEPHPPEPPAGVSR